jgi:hypothetical protein
MEKFTETAQVVAYYCILVLGVSMMIAMAAFMSIWALKLFLKSISMYISFLRFLREKGKKL